MRLVKAWMKDRPQRARRKRGASAEPAESAPRLQHRRTPARGAAAAGAPDAQVYTETPFNTDVACVSDGSVEQRNAGHETAQPDDGPSSLARSSAAIPAACHDVACDDVAMEAAPEQDLVGENEQCTDEGGRAAREGKTLATEGKSNPCSAGASVVTDKQTMHGDKSADLPWPPKAVGLYEYRFTGGSIFVWVSEK